MDRRLYCCKKYKSIKTYIALLRGINVSGHKKILMADLRNLLQKIGFIEVQTYIQSGNVVFSSSEDKTDLERIISEAILKKYGWEVPVLVLTSSEINLILENCPFSDEKKEKSYFVLLQAAPSSESIAAIESVFYPNEEFVITNSCVYLYSEFGAAKAKLGTNFFERKLKVKATARNYRTMNKLLEMSGL